MGGGGGHQASSVMATAFGGGGLPRVAAGDALAHADLGAAGRWGLLGLLGVIRMESSDINMLALGDDLTTLGLNLNATDVLFSSFESPWAASRFDGAGADKPAGAGNDASPPPFALPRCYKAAPGYIAAKLEPPGRLPRSKVAHYSKFQLETLFYIFFSMPRDILALYAAQELYNRDWQYHKEMKLWFTRATQADGMVGGGAGGQFIYFDVNAWERRLRFIN